MLYSTTQQSCWRFRILFGFASLIALCGTCVHATELTIQTLPTKVHERTQSLNADFLAATPERSTSKKNFPVLIFLHGGGGRGSNIQKIRQICRGVENGLDQFVDEPSILIAPQALQGWRPEDLNILYEYICTTMPVDHSRIYLTGNSMGGYGTWVWAAHSPQHFAAIAPVVGGLGKNGPKDITPELDQWAENLTTIPVWAFHGENDTVVPADRSEQMVKLIQDKGGALAKCTIFPNEGHGASRKVYTSQEFFEWLFSRKRESNAD
jgi:predicted peptidase